MKTTDSLLGRLLVLDDPDGERWTLSRFAARITEQTYLMDCLNPNNGETNPLGCTLSTWAFWPWSRTTTTRAGACSRITRRSDPFWTGSRSRL